MVQQDERLLSVPYGSEVMGRRGRSQKGGYYNLADSAKVKAILARSGRSSNSSTLYHYVQILVRHSVNRV